MLALAPQVIFALLVSFAVSSANAVQVVTADYYSQAGCMGPKTTAPFFVSGRCQGFDLSALADLGGGLGGEQQIDPNTLKFSYSFTCNGISLYTGATNCSTVTPTEFPLGDYCTTSGAGSVKYGCADYPSDRIALMQLGECTNTELVKVNAEIVILLDTCLPNDGNIQSFATGTHYKLTKSADQTLTYTTYTNAACTQGATVAFTGKLNAGCGASGGATRRLQGASISASFQTVPGGNAAASTSTHVALSLLAVFGMLAVLF